LFICRKNRVIELIKFYIDANKALGFIRGSEGFINHGIDVGAKVYDSSSKAIQKYHSLEAKLIPDALRVYGNMHDFGKIEFGDPFHEIHAAYLILTRGDKDELGLVAEGSQSERKEILKYIASLFAPDYAIYEELGGRQKEEFPDGFLQRHYLKPDYLPKGDPGVVEKVNYLRRELSPDKTPLTLEQFALPDLCPNPLAAKFAMHADLTDSLTFEERIIDIKERFWAMKEKQFGDYFALISRLTDAVEPRLRKAMGEVERLIN